MKSKIFSTIVIISLLILYGCNTNQVTLEQSKENFINYYDYIQKIVKQYGCELVKTQNPMVENQDSCMDLDIYISENEKIYMRFINSAYSSSKGTESFSIEYTISNNKTNNTFKIDLFVDLINSVSGKLISNEFCSSFLQAPEEQYSAEDYGFSKSDGVTIYKYYPLNFMEDWTIYYIQNEDNDEVLLFGGYTMYGSK